MAHQTPAPAQQLEAVDRVAREESNRNSPFFKKLPAEIRNKIYELVLPAGELIDARGMAIFRKRFRGASFKPNRRESDWEEDMCRKCSGAWWRTKFGITQACRQMQFETVKMMYSSITLVFGHLGVEGKCSYKNWIASRPPGAVEAITKFITRTIKYEPAQSDAGEKMVGYCTRENLARYCTRSVEFDLKKDKATMFYIDFDQQNDWISCEQRCQDCAIEDLCDIREINHELMGHDEEDPAERLLRIIRGMHAFDLELY